MKSTASGSSLEFLTTRSVSREQVEAAASDITRLFLEREKSFGVNPDVTVDYPDLAEPGSTFLRDPAGYVRQRRDAAAAAGAPHERIVILTTYGDRVHDALVAEGFQAQRIDMPAGPDHTHAFVLGAAGASPPGHILYVEAVNEADPKISPGFALRLLDKTGKLQGGACGSIHARDGRNYAWLAILVVAPGLPQGTGTALARQMLDLLRRENIATIHLGTQTAAPFYERLGFRTTHHLISGLRFRHGGDGQSIPHDLVMMELNLRD